jgi:hypothetical protein
MDAQLPAQLPYNNPVDQPNILNEKICTRCGVVKSIDNFMRPYGVKKGPFAICNRCSEKKKQSSTSKNPNDENPVQADTSESNIDSSPLIESDEENEEDEGLIYEMSDLEGLVAARFQDEGEVECIEFSAIIELSNDLSRKHY